MKSCIKTKNPADCGAVARTRTLAGYLAFFRLVASGPKSLHRPQNVGSEVSFVHLECGGHAAALVSSFFTLRSAFGAKRPERRHGRRTPDQSPNTLFSRSHAPSTVRRSLSTSSDHLRNCSKVIAGGSSKCSRS